MKFILGTKQKMTQYFDEAGKAYGATIVSAGPITVTQVKNVEKDGYEAVQVGYGIQKESRLSKAILGHLRKKGPFKVLREFRNKSESLGVESGDVLDVSQFEVGDSILVTGISKGRGFQGVVKRHGFHGGRRSHGQKHSEREPGSIGAGGIQRVFKGTRMGGRMGSDKVQVKNLKVLAVDPGSHQLLIGGAVPGHKGTILEIRG